MTAKRARPSNLAKTAAAPVCRTCQPHASATAQTDSTSGSKTGSSLEVYQSCFLCCSQQRSETGLITDTQTDTQADPLAA